MRVDDIRVFIPAKDFTVSKAFYTALGFNGSDASEDLTLYEKGDCYFFLSRFYNQELATNLMMQLSVHDIDEAYEHISSIQGFDIKFTQIKTEPWGKVVYLWGPSGELWHVTEFNSR